MKYIKENIEKMLAEHKDNEAKITEIELKIDEYQKRLEYAGTVYQDTEKEIIENMQLKGRPFDSINSNTNKVSDKVFDSIMHYHDEERHINKEDRQFLINRIESLTEEKDILNKKVVRIKNLIDPLSAEEKFVIEMFYINKCKWDYIEKEYFKEFEKYKSVKRLQAYRDKAMERMLQIINVGL